ncbi:radical SAM/CxCxxxxC motif protein YfkAB [Chengkuizengella axinellae]|uniref:Radical SAM/CxCxxxxC motif protein YfkAB n=1 Tax=Chengkuizengella axinellae TaxID=3064388 RepID=A0ABT9J0D7_9BACL|nr:radical SAM/CxCxxxxC motif protein YfkAB [Chengkuizengella sp. 2205SS18-9]MDP5275077.1 radical SAM/CxCxxxxC motif protein YfkAB [Chengkuizengella sp. 2205SS18-9]
MIITSKNDQTENSMIAQDPWDPFHSLKKHGKHVLTSIELTISNLCNMRCEHCAVGDSLSFTEEEKIPLDLIINKLDEVEHLQTISITGGEPFYKLQTVKDHILPILKYARERGIKTQINSNLTLDYARYELIAPYLDVMHISFNYENAEDFYEIGFARSDRRSSILMAEKLYEQMISNTVKLSKGGLFISAESMLNARTHDKIVAIHKIISEMGCKRHEVHPMYPTSFAENLPLLSLSQIRDTIQRLLDGRDKGIWMLFGTLPFYYCSYDVYDRQLLTRLQNEPNVTVRNDPDGRNRLNIDLFNGNMHVTDFSDLSAVGSIKDQKLDEVFEKWLQHPINQTVNCFCAEANCCGPNLLVKDAYYNQVNFKERKAILNR